MSARPPVLGPRVRASGARAARRLREAAALQALAEPPKFASFPSFQPGCRPQPHGEDAGRGVACRRRGPQARPRARWGRGPWGRASSARGREAFCFKPRWGDLNPGPDSWFWRRFFLPSRLRGLVINAAWKSGGNPRVGWRVSDNSAKAVKGGQRTSVFLLRGDQYCRWPQSTSKDDS